VEFDCAGKKRIVSRENSGSEQWETLTIKTKLPAGADPNKIVLRAAAYPKTRAAVVDSFSAMMVKDEPDSPVETELLINGSFEQAKGGEPEGWKVLPREAGKIEAGETPHGAAILSLLPIGDKKFSTLQQMFYVGAQADGHTLNAKVDVKSPEAGKVSLILISVQEGKEKRLAVAANTGTEGWETVTASATVDPGITYENLQFRVVLRPGATQPVLVDGASVRVAE
jgi:hypothetical protein